MGQKNQVGDLLTAQQLAVMKFIAGYWVKNLRSPSVRDIGVFMGISSPNGVLCHLKALTEKGQIKPIGEGSHRMLFPVGVEDDVRNAARRSMSRVMKEIGRHPIKPSRPVKTRSR